MWNIIIFYTTRTKIWFWTTFARTRYSKNQSLSSYEPKCEGIDVIWPYLMSNPNSWYTYLQCSVILNNHKISVLALLIMKNESDDDINVMIMIEKIRKSFAFYVNSPTIFLYYFPNFSCSSANYFWFLLEHINKMDCHCWVFWKKKKIEVLRGRVKESSKEKVDKEKNKIEQTYKKIASIIH